jgi:hypothetical protein
MARRSQPCSQLIRLLGSPMPTVPLALVRILGNFPDFNFQNSNTKFNFFCSNSWWHALPALASCVVRSAFSFSLSQNQLT